MPRYALILEYDGGPFRGWQRQADGPSVQEALETALAAFCGEPVGTIAAGRTDAGVHAVGQTVHVDLPRFYPSETVREATNAHLRPLPAAVVAARPAADDFHARFDATGRLYCYDILNRRAPAVLERGRVWHVPRPLDAELMHEAAQALVGRHDFTSFRAALCQARSPEKTLDRLSVVRRGERVTVEARARSFLHHQVRNIVGTLKKVGDGSWPVRRVAEALAARDRGAAGPTAPAHGLCLVAVEYGAPTRGRLR